MWACDFAPQGWAMCDGSLLPIDQNAELYAVLETQFGGDGVTTFALPDMRGRACAGAGAGEGLTARSLGQSGGAASVALTENQMPAHTHQLLGIMNTADSTSPAGCHFAGASVDTYAPGSPTEYMSPAMIAESGQGAAHDNTQPYLGINFMIAIAGVYPVPA